MCDSFSHIDGLQLVGSSDIDGHVSSSCSAGQLPRPKLLIVDDDFRCAHFFSHAAGECGYEARISRSPEEFRREYQLAPPDAVLVDLSMPEGDGVELLRFLAEQRCTAKVVLTSGVGQRILDAAMRLGEALGLRMANVLPKPFVVHDLAEALSSSPHNRKEASPCLR